MGTKTSAYTRPYAARRLVSARLFVTDTLLAHFRSNLAHREKNELWTNGRTDTSSYRNALATKNEPMEKFCDPNHSKTRHFETF